MNEARTKKIREYRQLAIKPSKSELENYYKSVYFQQAKGSYEKKYTDAELRYSNNNLRMLSSVLQKILKTSLKGKSFLDLGAGEGWALNHFHKLGCDVTGVDLTSFGLKNFNKGMKKYFVESSIDNFIDATVSDRKVNFDIINLTNVIEHVEEPEKLLSRLKSITKKNGIICVTFPNDFSPLHKILLKKKKINKEFWVVSPDHISYFNKDSFSKMTNRLGFTTINYFADFPIDLFLLNDHSNYVADKTKGKQAHFSRIDFINLACRLNFDATTDWLLKLGEIGLGRNLSAMLKIK